MYGLLYGIFIKSNSASEECTSGWMIPYTICIEFYIYIYIYRPVGELLKS